MQIYGFPAIDGPGGGVKVAFFRKGVICTPETIDRTVREDEIREMCDRVAELLPALDGPCLHSATCMYSNTPDEHFVHRPTSGQRECDRCVWIPRGTASSSSLWSGEILADLATTGSTNHPISLFDPRRLVTK